MAERQEPRQIETGMDKANMSEAQRRSLALAEAAEEAERKQLDESPVPGGMYLLDDKETLVNANGERIDRSGKVQKD